MMIPDCGLTTTLPASPTRVFSDVPTSSQYLESVEVCTLLVSSDCDVLPDEEPLPLPLLLLPPLLMLTEPDTTRISDVPLRCIAREFR